MLSITINNKSVSLPREFSLRLTWVNPACAMGEIPGDVGLGIEFLVNEINRSILGNPQRFEKYRTGEDRKYPNTEIRFSGILLMAGTLRITNSTHESYSGWLQNELGVMGEEQRDKFIVDLDWKSDVEFDLKESYDPDVDQYCKVKIRNEHFWEGKGAHGNVMIPYINEDEEPDEREEFKNYLGTRFEESAESFINEEPIDYIDDLPPGEIDPNHGRVISPFLFFRYLVKEALRLNRFYIRNEKNALNLIPGVANMVLYNNYNIFDPEPFTVDRNFTSFNRRRNTYETVLREVIDSVTWRIKPFAYRDLVPKISMKDFLLSIQNFLNVCFVFNTDRTVSIIDREAVISGTAIDLTPYMVGEWEKKDQKYVSLKFKAEYDKNDANFGDEFHDLSDRWQDFRDPVETYQDLTLITSRRNPNADRTLGQLRYVRSENKIYEFKWTVHHNEESNYSEEQTNILAWEFVSSGPQYFVYRNGDEIENIETKISTLQMDGSILTALQKGNVNAMRNLWSDFSFRLFYYISGDVGSVIHGASATSCNWEGETGLFEKRWKKWARFWANRLPVEARFDFPINVLDYVKRNITSKFRTERGEFIIEEIETEIGIDRIGLTTIRGYKL